MDEKNVASGPQANSVEPTPVKTPVIETASATTSHENAGSGSKPLVIAGIGLLLAFIMLSSLTRCTLGVVGLAVDGYGGWTHVYDDRDMDDLDFDDLLDEDGWEDIFGGASSLQS